jgi:hypothetical protein
MTEAPEKIYGWRDTQLSVARHYGGCKFRGASYLIDFADPLHPLVRQDVLEAGKKAAKAAKLTKAGKVQDTTQEMFQA